jgi:hypothetical protein
MLHTLFSEIALPDAPRIDIDPDDDGPRQVPANTENFVTGGAPEGQDARLRVIRQVVFTLFKNLRVAVR